MTVEVLTCADCSATTLRRGPTQIYCVACSTARDRKRKAEWQAKNGKRLTPKEREHAMSRMVDAGAERSLASRASIAWDAGSEIAAHTVHRVVVPFDYAASKNAVWRFGRGHVYARSESNALREELTAAISRGGHRWFQGKVWIDVFVEKPNHRGDAVNVIDLVCDAVKDAIGVDDRWFSIARLDWAIVKRDPRLIVGVRQAVTEDHQVCSHCGHALPLPEFGRNRSTPTGYARVCRPCAAPVRGPRAAAA